MLFEKTQLDIVVPRPFSTWQLGQQGHSLATRSTDLLEGPQYSTVFLPLPSASSWRLILQNRYTSLMPVFVLPDPADIHSLSDPPHWIKNCLGQLYGQYFRGNRERKRESVKQFVNACTEKMHLKRVVNSSKLWPSLKVILFLFCKIIENVDIEKAFDQRFLEITTSYDWSVCHRLLKIKFLLNVVLGIYNRQMWLVETTYFKGPKDGFIFKYVILKVFYVKIGQSLKITQRMAATYSECS